MVKCLQKKITNDLDVTNEAWYANGNINIDMATGKAEIELNGYTNLKTITDGVPPNCVKVYKINNIYELKNFKDMFNEILAKMVTDTSQEFAGAVYREVPK